MVESRESSLQRALPRRKQFYREGFTFVRGLLTVDEIEQLRETVGPLLKTGAAGVRNLLRESTVVAELARSERVLNALGELVEEIPFPVRGILFDKTPQANWSVAWHQDLTIAVKARAETPGFGPWSVKEGVVHVQAPQDVLERMLTIRIHLDDANETNGALSVIPGSHLSGKLENAAIERAAAIGPIATCAADAGDALVMRPLLLHASSPAPLPSHRRIIHIEYATNELPPPLEWSERAR